MESFSNLEDDQEHEVEDKGSFAKIVEEGIKDRKLNQDLDIPSTRIGIKPLRSSRITASGKFSSKPSMKRISIKPAHKPRNRNYQSQKRKITTTRGTNLA